MESSPPRLASEAKQLTCADDIDVTQPAVGPHPIDVSAGVIDGIDTAGDPRVVAGRQAQPGNGKISLDGLDAISKRR